MKTEDIRLGMVKAIEENPISDILAREALADIIDETQRQNPDLAAKVIEFIELPASLDLVLQAIKNTAILLSAADIMRAQPNLLDVFSLALKEIAPPPQNGPIRDVVLQLIEMDLAGYENPGWKRNCFQSYFD